MTSRRIREKLRAREVPAYRVPVTGTSFLKWLVKSKTANLKPEWVRNINGCKKNLEFVSTFLLDFCAPAGSVKSSHGISSGVLVENHPDVMLQEWAKPRKFVRDWKRN